MCRVYTDSVLMKTTQSGINESFFACLEDEINHILSPRHPAYHRAGSQHTVAFLILITDGAGEAYGHVASEHPEPGAPVVPGAVSCRARLLTVNPLENQNLSVGPCRCQVPGPCSGLTTLTLGKSPTSDANSSKTGLAGVELRGFKCILFLVCQALFRQLYTCNSLKPRADR